MYEQSQIGNHRIWQVFLTQTWRDIQEHLYRQHKKPKNYTGSRWVQLVIKEIYRYALQVWTNRNEALHETLEKVGLHHKHLLTKLEILYQKNKETSNILPGLYKYSLEILKKKPDTYIKHWIKIAAPVEKYQQVENKRRKGQAIRQYLNMAEKPPEKRNMGK